MMRARSLSSGGPGQAPVARAFADEFDYVYRTFRRLGVQPAQAEDLAQEVFVVLCRRWSDFRDDLPLRPWLTGIAHRVAMDHARKHSRREVPTLELEQEDDTPRPDDRLASARARTLALRALAMLPEHHRSVLVRHELDGLSIRTIAKEWEIPFFTVAARLRRARIRFNKVVKQLQLGGGKLAVALLPARAVLDAERALPPAPSSARDLLRRLPPAPASIRAVRRPDRWFRHPLGATVGAVLLGVLFTFALRQWRGAGIGDARAGVAVVKATRSPPLPRLREPSLMGPGPAPAVTLASVSAATPAASSLERGLLARWRFEDAPGSLLAEDSSGNDRPCLIHDLDLAAARVEGTVGRGLDLGRTGWLECPLPEARAGVPFELSMAIWMKQVPTKKKRDTVLFTRQLADTGTSHLFWFGVRENFLAVWSWAWNGWTTGSLPPPGVWTHVAFVHGKDETRLYVNGMLVRHKTRQTPRGEGLVQSALTIGGARFGAEPQLVRHHFDGVIDEAVVYDRTLGEAEIRVLAAR
jgi:RNA polymerase sigma-70 factor (ECF subfamily)